ncbi:hypothetical protein BH10ACI2_BH10ACI2_10920 [soil metagenome]
MIKRNQPQKQKGKLKKTGQPRRWPTFVLMGACGVVLLSGFFLAGRQHFASMDIGMKNSRLRRQIDELEGEKRRLLLGREVALSPAEIKKAVKKIGLTDALSTEGQVAQVAATTKDKAVPPVPAQTKPMIVKTASVSATHAPVESSLSGAGKLVKQIRKTLSTE